MDDLGFNEMEEKNLAMALMGDANDFDFDLGGDSDMEGSGGGGGGGRGGAPSDSAMGDSEGRGAAEAMESSQKSSKGAASAREGGGRGGRGGRGGIGGLGEEGEEEEEGEGGTAPPSLLEDHDFGDLGSDNDLPFGEVSMFRSRERSRSRSEEGSGGGGIGSQSLSDDGFPPVRFTSDDGLSQPGMSDLEGEGKWESDREQSNQGGVGGGEGGSGAGSGIDSGGERSSDALNPSQSFGGLSDGGATEDLGGFSGTEATMEEGKPSSAEAAGGGDSGGGGSGDVDMEGEHTELGSPEFELDLGFEDSGKAGTRANACMFCGSQYGFASAAWQMKAITCTAMAMGCSMWIVGKRKKKRSNECSRCTFLTLAGADIPRARRDCLAVYSN